MLQPWKLITLALGLLMLIAGSFYEHLADWDIGVSLVMGTLTYLTAPFVIRVIIERRWRMLSLAVLFAWFSIDGSYSLYNEIAGHPYLRDANALASTPLYFMMGFFWYWNGSVKELIHAVSDKDGRGTSSSRLS